MGKQGSYEMKSHDSVTASSADILDPKDAEVGASLNKTSLIFKIVKTISVVLIWVCIGLWAEVNGPTLPDLMYRTSSNYKLISQAISMRGAGNLAGSVLGGGYIVDKFHSKAEFILAACMLFCAGLNAAVPFIPYIELLFVVYAIEGWMEALVNIAGQVVIMDIWRDRASGPLHLIHLGFGAGGFMAPQIVAPFISDKLPKPESDGEVSIGSTCYSSSSSTTANITNSSILTNETLSTSEPAVASGTFQYGFLIISAIIVAIALLWVVYGINDRKKAVTKRQATAKSIREIFNLNTCAPGRPGYAFVLYALLFFWIYLAVAGERIFAKYLFSYARDFACFGKNEAANLLTAFWISFTLGRFAGFVVANFLHMKYIIFIEGIGNLVSGIVLYFYGTNVTVLWIFVCVSGVLIGPCYPSGLSWANRYMIVTATGVTVLSIGAGVSDLSFLATIGHYINDLGIQVMVSFVLGFGVILCIMPIIMQSIAHQLGDRFENERQSH